MASRAGTPVPCSRRLTIPFCTSQSPTPRASAVSAKSARPLRASRSSVSPALASRTCARTQATAAAGRAGGGRARSSAATCRSAAGSATVGGGGAGSSAGPVRYDTSTAPSGRATSGVPSAAVDGRDGAPLTRTLSGSRRCPVGTGSDVHPPPAAVIRMSTQPRVQAAPAYGPTGSRATCGRPSDPKDATRMVARCSVTGGV